MANVNTNPQYKANLSYHGFPIQQRKKFSSSVGQIIPVYYDMLNPGDKVRCAYELETRTMPLDSAAMMHVTENVDWFFVPLEQIFKLFSEYYYNVQDITSNIFAANPDPSVTLSFANSLRFPSIPLSAFITNFAAEVASGTLSQDKYRLLEMVGFPIKRILEELCYADDNQSTPRLNSAFALTPWFVWAYNKIWFDYFRLEDRIENDPRYYNVDKFYNSQYLTNTLNANNYIDNVFKIRYCPWEKDFYTYNQIAPIYGNFVIGGLSNPTIENLNQWLTAGNLKVIDNTSPSFDQSYTPTTVLAADHTTYNSTATGIDTAQIRSAFALEKLLEITRRAGKNYDAQTLAHFGVKVPEGIGKQAYHLGHSESDLVIRDVISTSDTAQTGSSDGAPLGQIAGKAYGFGKDGNVSFEAKCHGILMAVYYARPNVDYIVNGFDKFNAFSKREDFYIPEFDNLGMQPLFGYQLDVNTQTTQTAVYGWQYRYMEYKQKLNEVHGAMAGTLDYWTPARDIQVPSNSNGFATSFFYVDPTYLNKVMVTEYIDGNRTFDNSWTPATDGSVNYDIAYETIYNRDPLIHDMLIAVTKASKMSTYGLPQL